MTSTMRQPALGRAKVTPHHQPSGPGPRPAPPAAPAPTPAGFPGPAGASGPAAFSRPAGLPGPAGAGGAAGPAMPGGAGRLLGAGAVTFAEHLRKFGRVPLAGGLGRVLPVVEASGLTGRGGAGFPTWRKLATVAAAGEKTVVIGNGAEGEPASRKDKTLLVTAPHLVLDGLQVAAEAVGAERAYLYVVEGPVAERARRAIAERAGADPVPVGVVIAPEAFLSGEKSAVVSRVAGGPALPRDKAARVSEAGVRGRPTLVQNVETLAQLALLARYGPAWYRAQGTRDEPGTMLTTVSGAVGTPAVHEIPIGLPLRDLLRRADTPGLPATGSATSGAAGVGGAGGIGGVLVGGFHGTWLPPEALDAPVSRAGLEPWQASPGAGVVVVLAADSCGLAETARIVRYLAEQSARQCGPCLNGLPALAHQLGRLAHGDVRPDPVPFLHRLTGLVTGRGACHHPDGTVRLVRSALTTFADDVQAHRTGRCLAATHATRQRRSA
jgi:NADH:ubiquinone oxidoreductase subunit F (NADH-binding)